MDSEIVIDMTCSKDPLGSITEGFELLERHISILKTVRNNQPIGLIRLSEMTGIPKHKVRYSLKLLEQQGIIKATTEGAIVTDEYDRFMHTIFEYVDGLSSRIDEVRDNLEEKF